MDRLLVYLKYRVDVFHHGRREDRKLLPSSHHRHRPVLIHVQLTSLTCRHEGKSWMFQGSDWSAFPENAYVRCRNSRVGRRIAPSSDHNVTITRCNKRQNTVDESAIMLVSTSSSISSSIISFSIPRANYQKKEWRASQDGYSSFEVLIHSLMKVHWPLTILAAFHGPYPPVTRFQLLY